MVVAARREFLLFRSASRKCSWPTLDYALQPICGPVVGGIAGALAYDLLIFTGPGRFVKTPPAVSRSHNNSMAPC